MRTSLRPFATRVCWLSVQASWNLIRRNYLTPCNALWQLTVLTLQRIRSVCLNGFGNRTSPSDNSNNRWKRLCLVSWAASPCVWTLRALTRNLLTYLLTTTTTTTTTIIIMLLQRWFLEKKRKWWWCCERWRLQTVNNTSCGEIKHTSQSSPTSSDTFPPEVTSSQFRLTYLLTRPEIWTSAGLTTMTRNTLVRSEFVLRFSSLSFAYLRLFFRITIFIHTNLFFYLYSKLFKRTFETSKLHWSRRYSQWLFS